jgi:plastocyanin
VKILLRISLLSLLFSGGFAMVVPAAKISRAAAPVSLTEAEVKIDNFSFGPQIITVAPGTKVTWKNRDDIPHTVVSADGVFKSRALDTDESFSFTFDKPGTYSYFCSIHPKMTGQVTVK